MTETNAANINGNAVPSEPFTLAPGDEARDRKFQSRLDLDTAVLRRRYEIVINERCPRVKNLDGLPFQKADVFRKDTVYDELRNLGLIKPLLPLGEGGEGPATRDDKAAKPEKKQSGTDGDPRKGKGERGDAE